MAYDELMVSRFRDELAKLNDTTIQEKAMFGALGFMINGKVAVCVGDKDVMYKLGAQTCEKLISQGVAEPVVMKNRTMKDWVNIYFHNLEDQKKFIKYLSDSLDYALKNSQ